MSGATAEEFKKWREHAAMVGIDSLRYIIKDCAEAREAFKGWNPERENHYADQCFTYSDELYRRNKLVCPKTLQTKVVHCYVDGSIVGAR